MTETVPIERPRERSWLARHPRTCALLIVLVLAIAADLVAGRFLIEPNPGSFRCSHPYYHHGFRPNVSSTTRWGPYEYAIHTNSLGFLDSAPREVPLESDKRRILVIGDSFVEGIGLPWEQGFVAELERRLGPEIEVLNAGGVSYCPMIYELKVRYLIEEVGLRFDQLVVFIDISDIQDEVNYQSFVPHLPSLADRVGARAHAFLSANSLTTYAVEELLRKKRGGVSTAIDPSKMVSADIEFYYQDLEAYKDGGQEVVEIGRWEWTFSKPLLEAWGRKGLRLAEEDMSELVDLCKAHGIGVVVCVYPSPAQIIARDLNSIQVQTWRHFTKEKQVGFMNLFPKFIGEEVGRAREVYREYFIEGDVHWNPAGHRLVAEELLKHL